ncbi:hypothetical protein [Helicobacter macacae]|uniref:Autotransporter domain-containing protein n=1 Tax=Helicobacter macacae MIT 99-5501 TaxID=1357400 RepID=V8C9W0_9HELI|nr:hypothetical protein [Helicobacter macacae]ETD23506.1 hypothetical protein HMPREF2086_01311 [Helicobacter macacae MIT 99-5501]
MQNPLDISVSAKPQYDKAGGHNVVSPSIVGGDSTYSPSLARDNLTSSPSLARDNLTSSPSLASGLNPISSPSLAEGARGWVDTTSALQARLATANAKDTHPQTPSAREGAFKIANSASQQTTPSKPKRLALSLITASALTGLALDIAAAQCAWNIDWAHGGDANNVGYAGKVDCTGVSNNIDQFLKNGDGYNRPTYYRSNYWNLSGSTTESTITTTFDTTKWNNPTSSIASVRNFNKSNIYQEVNFNSFNGSNTSFTFQSGSSDSNPDLNYNRVRINVNSGTRLKELHLTGHFNQGVGITGSTITTLETKTGTISALNISGSNITSYTKTSGNVNTLNISGSNINSFTNTAGNIGTLTISGSTLHNALTVNGGNITNLNIEGGTTLSKITGTGTGTINTLSIGNRSGGYGSANIANYDLSSLNVGTLNLFSASLTINSPSGTWNQASDAGSNNLEHIYVKNSTSVGVATNSVRITLGQGARVNEVYYYNKIITGANVSGVNANHVQGAPGVGIEPTAYGTGFLLSADVATSYGSSVYRALALSSLRRNAMTQNILDTMTTKTFHSDRYYNQEVELRLLQYDLSRLTNRSSKFSKQTRKNQSKVDKVREKMAKLTLEQSKGQNLDKGYNNFELIDQLDAIFIPYTGRRDWRFFALPYASHSYVDLGASSAMEYAGGAVFGVQRNLRAAGIFGGYLGYEFVNTDTELVGAATRVQTHSLQAGLNYFKTFSFTSKTWEGFLRANVRGGVDLPQFNFNTGVYNLKLESNEKASSIPLLWNVGAEVKGGITFYYFKRNSYLSPEVSLSYDMLSTFDTWLNKPTASLGGTSFMPLGAHEYYKGFYWHLPQIGAAVRYYKMWGNTFRTNLKAGIKYNMLNKQDATFRIGDSKDFEDTSAITLPAVYGNLAFDFIWMIKKNHELSFGYDGLFYASTFDKSSTNALNNWFNGVTTTLNFKYAYWFGGTDYVTDKDGNAVSRSIAEGKKSKKSKKSKSKKSKKSKKKVYYIDG